jgi:hypothetical protein
MTERSFAALASGAIEHLDLAVCIAATRAKRDAPQGGIWRLDRATFLVIASQEAAIASIDEIGPENRFFRLNQAFADWLDATAPIAAFDFVVS